MQIQEQSAAKRVIPGGSLSPQTAASRLATAPGTSATTGSPSAASSSGPELRSKQTSFTARSGEPRGSAGRRFLRCSGGSESRSHGRRPNSRLRPPAPGASEFFKGVAWGGGGESAWSSPRRGA
eukprot:7399427-Alexandrium_andersonii.AAC.1